MFTFRRKKVQKVSFDTKFTSMRSNKAQTPIRETPVAHMCTKQKDKQTVFCLTRVFTTKEKSLLKETTVDISDDDDCACNFLCVTHIWCTYTHVRIKKRKTNANNLHEHTYTTRR